MVDSLVHCRAHVGQLGVLFTVINTSYELSEKARLHPLRWLLFFFLIFSDGTEGNSRTSLIH